MINELNKLTKYIPCTVNSRFKEMDVDETGQWYKVEDVNKVIDKVKCENCSHVQVQQDGNRFCLKLWVDVCPDFYCGEFDSGEKQHESIIKRKNKLSKS